MAYNLMTMRGRDVLRILNNVKRMTEERGFPPVDLDSDMSILEGSTNNDGQIVHSFTVVAVMPLASAMGI